MRSPIAGLVCNHQGVNSVTDTSAHASTPASAGRGLHAGHPLNDGRTTDSALVRAAECKPVPHTPVWFMRQAGRSLPEYRKVREGRGMLESCFDADLVAEVTLQPVRRHNVDAAIFFSDIVVPVKAIGVDIDIVAGVGPVVAEPFRTKADLARLRDLEASDIAAVTEAIGILTSELGSTPLIGFAGAPFTVASYLVEGRPSRDHIHTKALMYSDPQTWHGLLEQLSRICGDFLRLQLQSGASAVQLFDSWVGALSAREYRNFVLPHSRAVFDSIAGIDAPRIHFGVGTAHLLPDMHSAGATVMGIDFRTPLADAADMFDEPIALQGNLDPAVLFAGDEVIESQVRYVLNEALGLPGHIFNLGHGVSPDTDPDALTQVVSLVHDLTKDGRG